MATMQTLIALALYCYLEGTETSNTGSFKSHLVKTWRAQTEQRDVRRTSAVGRSEATQAPRGRCAPSEGPGSLWAEKRQWAAGNLHFGSKCTKKGKIKHILKGCSFEYNVVSSKIENQMYVETNHDLREKKIRCWIINVLTEGSASITKKMCFSFCNVGTSM